MGGREEAGDGARGDAFDGGAQRGREGVLEGLATDPDIAVELFMLEPGDRGVVAELTLAFPAEDAGPEAA